LFAPRNVITLTTFFFCASASSSAIFLILELDSPITGMIQISGEPLRNALSQLGK
jgi:hypothetical protein